MTCGLDTVKLACFGLTVHIDHLDELVREMNMLGLSDIFPATSSAFSSYNDDLKLLLALCKRDLEGDNGNVS